MKKLQRRHLSILAALATLTTTTAYAHPGINDHHDVLAAVHDLEHTTTSYPAQAAFILGLVLAIVTYRVIKALRKSRPKQSGEMKTHCN